MSLRPHMVAAYGGDGGAKALGRDTQTSLRVAKDDYRTGEPARDRVITALKALDRKLARRQAQLRRLHADVLERLAHETARANSAAVDHLCGGDSYGSSSLDCQENHQKS